MDTDTYRIHHLHRPDGRTYSLLLHPDLTVSLYGDSHPHLPRPASLPPIEWATDADLTDTEHWQIRRFERHLDALGAIDGQHLSAAEEYERIGECKAAYAAVLALHRALIALGDRSVAR